MQNDVFRVSALPAAGYYSFDIRGTETDYNDTLHMASLFAMMQEAAYKNAEALSMGASLLDKSGICWLLSKISVRMLRMPSWQDSLIVKTWSRGPKRLLFLRDFTFISGKDEHTGEIIGHASSEWFLAQRDTHRPVRPDQILDQATLSSHLKSPAVFDFECPRLKNLVLETDDQPLLVKYADFSDIDRNGHVNNTRYVAWAVDALQSVLSENTAAAGIAPMTVTGVDIQYISEVFIGSKVNIHAQKSPDGCYLVEGRRSHDDQMVFRSRLYFMESDKF